MSLPQKVVSTAAELPAASKDADARRLVVRGEIVNAPSIRLAPGTILSGDGDGASISFAAGIDGLELSSDNEVLNLSPRDLAR